MLTHECYTTLGVPQDATRDEIKKAYRRLARKHHPDVHDEDRGEGAEAGTERFRQVAEAYEILGDPKKREEYNKLLAEVLAEAAEAAAPEEATTPDDESEFRRYPPREATPPPPQREQSRYEPPRQESSPVTEPPPPRRERATPPPPAYRPPPVVPPIRRRRRRRWVPVTIGFGLAIVAVLLYMIWPGPSSPQYLASDLQTHNAYVTDVVFSPATDPSSSTFMIASSGADGAVDLSQIDGSSPLNQSVSGTCSTVAFTPDNSTLIAGCGANLQAQTTAAPLVGDATNFNTAGSVNDIVFSPKATNPQGGRLAVATSKGIELWTYSPQSGTKFSDESTLQPSGSVSNVAYSPNGQLLAGLITTGVVAKGPVEIWNTETGKLVASFAVPIAFQLAFNPEGTTLAISTLNGIEFWNVASHKLTLGIKYGAYAQGSYGPGGAIAYSPNGTVLAFADGWDHIELWSTSTDEQVAMLPTSASGQGLAYTLAFSPSNQYLASAGGASNCDGSCDDDSVHLWDVGTFTGVQSTG